MSLIIVDAWTTRAWAKREYRRLDADLQNLIGRQYRTLGALQTTLAEVVGQERQAALEYKQGEQRYRLRMCATSPHESRWQITTLPN